ncbi:MAG: nickel-dependent hydrogenase large subunit [Rhodospirillales bacterium]|nr:nickel-dependent hydrogenase large subunit [Rhodospirillales bacterium]
MTRLIVGPFNRVEGDLEVKLDIEKGIVTDAHVVSPMYRGFEQILQGKDPRDALVYAPRICGICSVSQSAASAGALAQAQGITDIPLNGQLSRNLIQATENVADHLTHFYLFFMPDFARDVYAGQPWFGPVGERFKALSGTVLPEMLPERAQFMHIMGLMAGKWPHTLSLQPGGSSKSIEAQEKARLSALLGGFRRFLERTLFGDDLDRIGNFQSLDELNAWRADKGPGHSDFTRFLDIADHLGLDEMGSASGRFMSYGAYHLDDRHHFAQGVFVDGKVEPLDTTLISEDVSHAWMQNKEALHPFDGQTMPEWNEDNGYTWCKAPRLGGQVVEVGALARQAVNGHPLIRDAIVQSGGNVRNRILARLLEIALVTCAMEKWTRQLQPKETFCIHAEMPDEARGLGLVEAARGSLGHWLRVKDGQIDNYQIVAPTTWNFSPRDGDGTQGALEQALIGAPVKFGETEPVAVQHIVRSFDPCMVCTVH